MSIPVMIGDIQITTVSGGRLWIDGGNMFGVIPRVMWERVSPPDSQYRIPLETNCFVIRTPDSIGLIDTGYGSKTPDKFRKRHVLEDGAPLIRNLAAAGLAVADIDWVVLTHLHFDHAGGCTWRDEHDQLHPTFPRAKHFVQAKEWDDGIGDIPELAGAYYPGDFKPLYDAGLVTLVDGTAQIVPGVTVQLSGGHTRGHQIVVIASGDDSAVCPCDICPTIAHLPTFWTMAYDQFPLDVRRVKRQILNDIVQQDRLIMFSHDPDMPTARLIRDDGQLTVRAENT